MEWQLRNSLHPRCVAFEIAGEELLCLSYAVFFLRPFAVSALPFVLFAAALASPFAASAVPFALFAAVSGASTAQ